MKKSIILFAVALGLFTSCDPIKEEKDFSPWLVTSSEIESAVKISQVDADGNPAADGNYFNYTTSPDLNVTIFNKLADGSENILARGLSGSFSIKPKRGSDPNQKFWIRVVGSDNQPIDIEKSVNVYVQQELDPVIRILASDVYGKKVWKWDPSITGAVWGNMGYLPGDGVSVGTAGNGQWWGVTSTDEFNGQLQHTATGANEGDGNLNAYMEIGDDGFITCFDESGNEIRRGVYSVEDYDPTYAKGDGWRVGYLKTDAILWPWIINTNGTLPSQSGWGPKAYEIVYLTADKMTLVYPGGNETDGANGSWGEATFWHFTSNSDIQGMAAGYEKEVGKSWTWDPSITGAVWGNMGYLPGDGASVGTSGNGQWWGVTSTDEFNGQLQHTATGANEGDGDINAYMTIGNDGNITSYKADGSVIRKGSYEITAIAGDSWKVGEMKTDAILWPWIINTNGTLPSEAGWGPKAYEIVYLTGDKMTLVYPGGSEGSPNGSWGEATFWHFKAK